jgi:hypothetical protein
MTIRYQLQIQAKTDDMQVACDQLMAAISKVPLSYEEAREVMEFIRSPQTLSWLFRFAPTFSASQVVVMAIVRPGYISLMRAIESGPAALLALVRVRASNLQDQSRGKGREAA